MAKSALSAYIPNLCLGPLIIAFHLFVAYKMVKWLIKCFQHFVTSQNLLNAVEDLNLNAVESLRGVPYLAIGKHLCGPATGRDLLINTVIIIFNASICRKHQVTLSNIVYCCRFDSEMLPYGTW